VKVLSFFHILAFLKKRPMTTAQDNSLKRSLSLDMMNPYENVEEKDKQVEENKLKKKKSRELESELIIKESDHEKKEKPTIEKRMISKLECLREMDEKNREITKNPISFILWRYSKESKNYKIGIKRLYFIEKDNTGKNKTIRPHKYIPMIESNVYCLENSGSKPHWVLKHCFSSIQDAFDFIISECKIRKKRVNVYEELSRPANSIPNQWKSLKEWLPSFYIEKFDIVAMIEDSSDEDEAENKPVQDLNDSESKKDTQVLNKNKEQDDSLYFSSSLSSLDLSDDEIETWNPLTCKSIPFEPLNPFLISFNA